MHAVPVINNGAEIVELSHVDVTFPVALVEKIEDHPLRVPDRSDTRMCLSRVTAGRQNFDLGVRESVREESTAAHC